VRIYIHVLEQLHVVQSARTFDKRLTKVCILLSRFYSFEQWVLRIVVNNTPRPLGNDSAAVIERQRLQDTAETMLRTALAKIFELAGGSL
jgi:hypothetical protein